YSHGINPVCGDELEITMKKSGDGTIGQIRFTGHGCVISQASSAIMAESLEGKSVADALSLVSAFKDMMLSKAAPENLPGDLEAAKALEGVRRFPTRIKCATLAWNTVAQGLAERGQAEFKEGS
ncbi:MAG TPA: SUF system NifU family Fe-S cluster assembly protein, partial [Elusimicrobiota bacterium]|nr:SUF system NifU family Fe-S cluster assembly protein [Elusimicrobiota bacterium]